MALFAIASCVFAITALIGAVLWHRWRKAAERDAKIKELDKKLSDVQKDLDNWANK